MKVIICFPPLSSEKGCPTLGQNRQFQYFKEHTYIYPVVPAQAATLLKTNGFEVEWMDCLAENISYSKFLQIIKEKNPDIMAIETKTPVIQEEWKLINELKANSLKLKAVLFGDHVTALPEESFQNSKVDFVIRGGDYDFLLLNLCQSLSNRSVKLEEGIYYRQAGEVKNTGDFKLNHDLNSLPFIDRELTKWKLYAYKNGNYKKTPGTYIMSGRDCWWGKCTFCSWGQLYTRFRVRKVTNVIDEISQLVNNYQIKEIMDDTGTFPCRGWLKEFCQGMIDTGLNKKVNLDCNMRFGAVSFDEYKMMKQAGFRLLLFGLESANQKTLDRIDKNLKVDTIISSCRDARRAGLYPHITLMFGYPWESYEDAQKTLKLGRWLLKKDYAYTMQATVTIPYPGTPLFDECQKNDLLCSRDWAYYDMKNPVMKLTFAPDKLLKLVQSMYSISFSPEFIFRKVLSIRNFDDLKYFSRAFSKVLGHIMDFRKRKR